MPKVNRLTAGDFVAWQEQLVLITVINWVKQAGSCLPEAPDLEEIPEVTQVDELETFVGKKKQDLVVDSCK